MATKRLMTDEQVELLKLVEGADSVELKLTVPAMYGRNAVQALGIDPLEAQIRQVGMAIFQIAQVGTAEQLASAREVLTNARRSLYGILAEEEEQPPEEA